MPADRAALDGWVERVLGVTPVPDVPPRPAGVDANVIMRWNAAVKVVGRQLAALSAAVRSVENPSLRAIADGELDRVMGGLESALSATLRDYGAGQSPRAAAKALTQCRALRRHIASEPRVAACDRNPFGAPVAIRATLGPVLAEVEAALSRR